MTNHPGAEDDTLADSLFAEPSPQPDAVAQPADSSRVKGLGRIFRGNKALWVTTLIAVVSLVGGLVLGRFVLSPADALASSNPPSPGYITVPVEFGEMSNDVTLRGQIGYADATEVKLTASELADGGAAVVTGHVPEVGDDLEAGSIALEIAGRPVFVLPGQLPAYRALRYGMSGPDVSQLKKALRGLGLKAGKGDKFDKNLSAALASLYNDAGYSPAVDKDASAGVATAREGVRAAEADLRSANEALKSAGVTKAVRVQEDNNVRAAKRRVKDAQAALKQAKADGSPQPAIVQAENAVADAKDGVRLAEAQRADRFKVDTSSLREAVKSAQQRLKDAKKQLTTAQNAARPYLPVGEVLFLTELPRRVDAVNVSRGSIVDAAVMSVSGATIQLEGTASGEDAKLLKVGAEAFFELPDGTQHRAVIEKIEAAEGGGRSTVTFTPDPLETEVIQQIQGSNVRVQVPVGATDGEVLSVPFAALTAGPGGESRVEVVDGDPKDPKATTRLVQVTTGLSARGYVEVTPTDGGLQAGDLVVVGE